MTNGSGVVGPAPMEGNGGYNSRSSVQASGASPAVSLLAQAARDVSLPAGSGPVVIADYGASQGRNSLVPMSAAVQTLRERLGRGRPISVVHTDLAQNDFSALFDLLNRDPASYLRQDDEVYASAIGRSFYEQILPARSVTLGWCAWSIQWLSEAPMVIPDHVESAYSRFPEVRAAYARQAAADWRTFLRHRAAELQLGGRLVVISMALTDEGDFGYAPVLTAMNETLQALVQEGEVLPEEAGRMVIPTVGRTRSEFAEPFQTGEFCGLTLDLIETFEGEDTIWQDYLKDGDALAFGARWAAFSRASVLPTLSRGLAAESAPSRIQGFVDRMEAGMAARLAAAPERSLMPLANLVLSASTTR